MGDDMTTAPDVVIVGSGAGGAASAWTLTARGLNVLLLEAGPRFEPSRDYRASESDWERHAFPVLKGSRGTILYGDLGELDPRDATLQSHDSVTPRAPLPTQRALNGFGYAHVMGVGGSTLQYVGEAHRLHPQSFQLAHLTGQGADWPISYDDLSTHYDAIEGFIGVAGPEQTTGRPRRGPLPLPAHPLSTSAVQLAQAGARLGLPFEANTRAALSLPFDDRPPCNYCAQCSRGCPIGDKGSADVTYLRHAQATGRLTIVALAPVTRIELSPSGAAAAVHYVKAGVSIRQETPILIVAAGAVQTPRLLLASAQADVPQGVANGSGQVGHNFMETLSWSSTALLEGLENSHMGLPADAVSWAENGPDAVAGAVGGCRYTSAVQEVGFTGPISYAQRLISGHGAGLHGEMRRVFGSAITAAATGAVLPDRRSNVTLSSEHADANGVPLPVISSVLTDNSLALLHHMARRCRALLVEAGADRIAAETSSWDTFSATHVFGTTRMGRDSATSVTDAWGRAHDHDNLYIADASVFPSSGGGESPSLTISALALRQALHIIG
jgi:choline dehydrogenase-like flavoprotein